jgi:glucose-1-phosphate adenylyltransferase
MSSSRFFQDTVTFILAGGQGEQLFPLTKNRAKPAVPFGGHYRIIDFVLSNCINSGLKRIFLLTQSKNHSLERHLQQSWNIFTRRLSEFLLTVPPQFRMGTNWYQGSADAVFQNIYILQQLRPEHVLVLSGDHIYRMDYGKMIQAHLRTGAEVTAAAAEFDRSSAARMGVLESDGQNRIVGFEEKPKDPKSIPGRPELCLVNMGAYVFETAALVSAVCEDARRESSHALGLGVLPDLVRRGKAFAYPFIDENRKNVQYWRDVPTLDSYYSASMDLVHVDPLLNLYDTSFPIYSAMLPYPPAKMIYGEGKPAPPGVAIDSMLSDGCIVSGGRVERSILSPGVWVHTDALVLDSILFDGVEVKQEAKVRKAIVDKGVKIPAGACIGYDLEQDARRFTMTEDGVVVIPENERLA